MEYSLTSNDREKYATYTRDSITGLDYAVNRYYWSQWGRFTSPDPYGGSMDPASPQSLNRYAYTQNDPVTGVDQEGLDSGCGFCVIWGPFPTTPTIPPIGGTSGGGTGGGPCIEVASRVLIDPQFRPCGGVPGGGGGGSGATSTDQMARTLLRKRLQSLAFSHCNKVFSSVIGSYSAKDFSSEISSTEFYDVTNPTVANLTQNQVSGNGNSTQLGNSLNPNDPVAATVLGGTSAPVLLGADFFSNSNPTFQGNVLFHELIHAYTEWDDAEIYSSFQKYGLVDPGYGNTDAISAWVSTDCRSTPTSNTWWN